MNKLKLMPLLICDEGIQDALYTKEGKLERN